jgi:hypothetical protein
MQTEAAGKGVYKSPRGTVHSRIQILTIEDLLNKKKPDIPPWAPHLQTPRRVKRKEGTPIEMDLP